MASPNSVSNAEIDLPGGRQRTIATHHGPGGASRGTGTDIPVRTGTITRAGISGKVTHAGWLGGYGKIVIIKDSSGNETRSAHLESINPGIRVGSWVDKGSILGRCGSTGNSNGSHLHFEYRNDGEIEEWTEGQLETLFDDVDITSVGRRNSSDRTISGAAADNIIALQKQLNELVGQIRQQQREQEGTTATSDIYRGVVRSRPVKTEIDPTLDVLGTNNPAERFGGDPSDPEDPFSKDVEASKYPDACKIGDTWLWLPPEQISISEQNAAIQIDTLRTAGSPIIGTGQSTISIELSLFFPNLHSINYQLRPLFAQMKRFPFLPIENYHIAKLIYPDVQLQVEPEIAPDSNRDSQENRTTDGFATVTLSNNGISYQDIQLVVAMRGITVQTVPGLPKALQANLTLTVFNYLPYTNGFRFLTTEDAVRENIAYVFGNRHHIKTIDASDYALLGNNKQQVLDDIRKDALKKIETAGNFTQNISLSKPYRKYYKGLLAEMRPDEVYEAPPGAPLLQAVGDKDFGQIIFAYDEINITVKEMIRSNVDELNLQMARVKAATQLRVGIESTTTSASKPLDQMTPTDLAIALITEPIKNLGDSINKTMGILKNIGRDNIINLQDGPFSTVSFHNGYWHCVRRSVGNPPNARNSQYESGERLTSHELLSEMLSSYTIVSSDIRTGPVAVQEIVDAITDAAKLQAEIEVDSLFPPAVRKWIIIESNPDSIAYVEKLGGKNVVRAEEYTTNVESCILSYEPKIVDIPISGYRIPSAQYLGGNNINMSLTIKTCDMNLLMELRKMNQACNHARVLAQMSTTKNKRVFNEYLCDASHCGLSKLFGIRKVCITNIVFTSVPGEPGTWAVTFNAIQSDLRLKSYEELIEQNRTTPGMINAVITKLLEGKPKNPETNEKIARLFERFRANLNKQFDRKQGSIRSNAAGSLGGSERNLINTDSQFSRDLTLGNILSNVGTPLSNNTTNPTNEFITIPEVPEFQGASSGYMTQYMTQWPGMFTPVNQELIEKHKNTPAHILFLPTLMAMGYSPSSGEISTFEEVVGRTPEAWMSTNPDIDHSGSNISLSDYNITEEERELHAKVLENLLPNENNGDFIPNAINALRGMAIEKGTNVTAAILEAAAAAAAVPSRGELPPEERASFAVRTYIAFLRSAIIKEDIKKLMDYYPEELVNGYGIQISSLRMNETEGYPDMHLPPLWPTDKFGNKLQVKYGGPLIENKINTPADFFMKREEVLTDSTLDDVKTWVNNTKQRMLGLATFYDQRGQTDKAKPALTDWTVGKEQDAIEMTYRVFIYGALYNDMVSLEQMKNQEKLVLAKIEESKKGTVSQQEIDRAEFEAEKIRRETQMIQTRISQLNGLTNKRNITSNPELASLVDSLGMLWGIHTTASQANLESIYQMVLGDIATRFRRNDMTLGMNKAFPTFKLYFIEKDGPNWLMLDDVYAYNAISSISVLDNCESSSPVAELEISNISGTLTDPAAEFDKESAYLPTQGMISEQVVKSAFVRSGCPIVIKMGYDNDPTLLPVVFAGAITQINTGEKLNVVAQGWGAELTQPIENFHMGMFSFGRNFGNIVARILAGIPGSDSLGTYSLSNESPNANRQTAWSGVLAYLFGPAFLSSQKYDNINLDWAPPLSFWTGGGKVYKGTLGETKKDLGLSFDWWVYNQTAWEALQEVILYHPNHILKTVIYNADNLQNIRSSVYMGPKNGYVKVTDRYAIGGNKSDEAKWIKQNTTTIEDVEAGAPEGLLLRTPHMPYITESAIYRNLKKQIPNLDSLDIKIKIASEIVEIAKTTPRDKLGNEIYKIQEKYKGTPELKQLSTVMKIFMWTFYFAPTLTAEALTAQSAPHIGLREADEAVAQANDILTKYLIEKTEILNKIIQRKIKGKELGEPVCPGYEPIINYHLVDDKHHIIKNEIRTSLDGMYNRVLLNYPAGFSFAAQFGIDYGVSKPYELDPSKYKGWYTAVADDDINPAFFRTYMARQKNLDVYWDIFGEVSTMHTNKRRIEELTNKINELQKEIEELKKQNTEDSLKKAKEKQQELDTNNNQMSELKRSQAEQSRKKITDLTKKINEKQEDLHNEKSSTNRLKIQDEIQKSSNELSRLIDTSLPPYVRVGNTILANMMKHMYEGELYIIGNPNIKAHDIIIIYDELRQMFGPVEVRQIIHHFSKDTGFISVITPNLIVDVLDVLANFNLGAMNFMAQGISMIQGGIIGGGALAAGITTGISMKNIWAGVLGAAGGAALGLPIAEKVKRNMWSKGIGYLYGRQPIYITGLFVQGKPFTAGLEGWNRDTIFAHVKDGLSQTRDILALPKTLESITFEGAGIL